MPGTAAAPALCLAVRPNQPRPRTSAHHRQRLAEHSAWASCWSKHGFYCKNLFKIYHPHFPFRVNFFCWNLLCLHDDTELSNLETCAHTDIKILSNKFRHWLQIGQAMILYTLEMLFMSKELNVFSFNLKNFWCLTCGSLNINVTPHNSCNHGFLHLWLQSLELHIFASSSPLAFTVQNLVEYTCTCVEVHSGRCRHKIQGIKITVVQQVILENHSSFITVLLLQSPHF